MSRCIQLAPRITPLTRLVDVHGVNSMRLPAIMVAATLMTVSANANELTGTLQKIKETNRVVLGIQEASVPFSYLDGDQKVIGYAVDICMRIVDAVKRELNLSNLNIETSPVTSSNRIPLMMNGTVDPRLLFHHQQRGAATPGGVHKFAFSVGNPFCFEEV
jgi:ABC-type amino acid transport substrate-binding protein